MKKALVLFLITSCISFTLQGQTNKEKQTALLAKYHHSAPFAANGLAMVCKKDTEHCGCIDTLGNKVIPFKYGMNFFYFGEEKPQFNSVNRMVVAKPVTVTQAIYGMIDEKGKTILPFEYHIAYHDFHSLDPFHVLYKEENEEAPKKYGVIDSLGNIVIPFHYDKIEKVEERNFILKKNNLYGIASAKGELVLPINYTKAEYRPLVKSIFIEKGNLWGAYTASGEEILPVEFSSIANSNSLHIISLKDSLLSFYDFKGKLLRRGKLEIDDSKYFTHNIPVKFPLILKKGDKYGIFDTYLNIVTPFKYDQIYPSRNYLFPSYSFIYIAKKGGKYGFITKDNKSKEGLIFTQLKEYGIVAQNDKFGWVNNKSELIIPCIYDKVNAIISNLSERNRVGFNSLYLEAEKEGKKLLLNSNGETITAYNSIDTIHSILTQNEKAFIIGKKNRKFGAIDTDGTIIVPFEYDTVQSDFNLYMRFKMGHYQFTKGEKSFMVDWDKGEVVESDEF